MNEEISEEMIEKMSEEESEVMSEDTSQSMSHKNKRALEEEYLYLSVTMTPEIRRLVKFLDEMGTISEEQREDILDEAAQTLKSQTLLDIILGKDDEAFDDFYEGSKYAHLWKSADIIVPENGPHEPSEEDIQEFLPELWPTESYINMVENPRSVIMKRIGPTHKSMNRLFEDCQGSSNEVYDLSLKVKGRLVMINNMTFEDRDKFPNRKTAEHDSEALDMVFSELGFEIEQHRDKKVKEMANILAVEKEKFEKHPNAYKCFFLVIMSYGCEGRYIFGTDSKGVVKRDNDSDEDNFLCIEKIQNIFAGITNLAKKPKVFILQADKPKFDPGYRSYQRVSGIRRSQYSSFGRDRDRMRHRMTQASFPKLPEFRMDLPDIDMMKKKMRSYKDFSMDKWSYHMKMEEDFEPRVKEYKEKAADPTVFLGTKSDGPETGADDDQGVGQGDPQNPPKSQKTKEDVLLAVSTSPERMRFGDIEFGSWFIQAYAYVMLNYAFQIDLVELFTKVNHLLRASTGGALSPHLCTSTCSLSKKLYFFPGLPPN